ncbi:polysialyltransferase family glycosyltransferase [Microbispora sp. GKU 823]|uniref:polysialyltransferase family glycosyltransferase n=1 Tax=Microbispora sp. GKU 823 TaxID=1652100 RepID=UPI00277B5B47|nr:polysialyltransferase family glycosyltransferase [Microbispora sp. GKU 823]
MSALGLVTAAEEAALHERMLRGLAARGHRTVLFKPHPAAGRRHARELRPVAAELGVDLLVAPETTPAEACFAAHRPELVAGCFSTALVTARRLFGLPVAAVGTDLVLERLTPYENSNRIPATIADATLPRIEADGTITEPPAADLAALVGPWATACRARPTRACARPRRPT